MLERITPRERSDLLVAWLAISIAFSLIFIRGGVTLETFLVFLIVSLLTVGIGFILHEMAHKFTAMRYGYWAEFRKDNLMLLIAVVMAALVGVVFAAPGATVIYGASITREQNGKISAAGPAVNLVLCGVFAILAWVAGMVSFSMPALVGTIGLQVNAMIAAFNMLPVSVLDGRKVLAWDPAVFVVMIVAAFGILLASYYILAP